MATKSAKEIKESGTYTETDTKAYLEKLAYYHDPRMVCHECGDTEESYCRLCNRGVCGDCRSDIQKIGGESYIIACSECYDKFRRTILEHPLGINLFPLFITY